MKSNSKIERLPNAGLIPTLAMRCCVFGKGTLRLFSFGSKQPIRCGGPTWQKIANTIQKRRWNCLYENLYFNKTFYCISLILLHLLKLFIFITTSFKKAEGVAGEKTWKRQRAPVFDCNCCSSSRRLTRSSWRFYFENFWGTPFFFQDISTLTDASKCLKLPDSQ